MTKTLSNWLTEQYGSVEEFNRQCHESATREWAERVNAYLTDPADFHAAWHYLLNHPIFGTDNVWDSRFNELLYVMVVKVDPSTERIEDDALRNTATRVWLEIGPTILRSESPEQWETIPDGMYPDGIIPSHDLGLDCGADTFEAAIVELAGLVREKYGDDRTRA